MGHFLKLCSNSTGGAAAGQDRPERLKGNERSPEESTVGEKQLELPRLAGQWLRVTSLAGGSGIEAESGSVQTAVATRQV